jgi:hypothetical protein
MPYPGMVSSHRIVPNPTGRWGGVVVVVDVNRRGSLEALRRHHKRG